jgi:hypothetical protein
MRSPPPTSAQLPLPLLTRTPPSPVERQLAPNQVWIGLPPVLRDQIRQTLVHVLQEVVPNARR